MTEEMMALLRRLVVATEEGNALKRIEMRRRGLLPDDGRPPKR